ncbi:transcriptional regulator, MarR family [Beutenbergia cavernae DSM 12333]|uniref:Transcriptional regulator, MarR family n=1 Tax=Beutenbergia cavernae (strain ATCC BAA-8 / DSM 12333 / CCUG 43141 / JCM 11478 / NBRC 16432 / NCIMB 13614 / HKI 0122) TaxID=471853 RepID=C5BZG3_BEUC1|nr:transcriptional regulator, MarR family [Beutenbergia cavernae DSM 12333]
MTRTSTAPARPDTPDAPKRPATQADLASQLRMGILRVSRRLRAERSGRLTEAQYCVLADLKTQGPMTPSELAEREQVQPPSMTRTVAGLADAGLVSRSEHPEDRRQVLVSLSDAGREVVVATRRRRDAWLARRIAALSADERRTLADAAVILRRIAAE